MRCRVSWALLFGFDNTTCTGVGDQPSVSARYTCGSRPGQLVQLSLSLAHHIPEVHCNITVLIAQAVNRPLEWKEAIRADSGIMRHCSLKSQEGERSYLMGATAAAGERH
jgi:hypothetical protein